MPDLVGKTLLNRYFLREPLGSGGMADVYVAWDNQRTTNMAVKVLRRDLALDSKFFRRFTREAEILRELEHPKIARIYEFERDGDIAFLVMDWIQGKSLSKVIDERNKPFSAAEVRNILSPISTALYYAHKKEVYHCDVKPANILVHNDGRVFLTDFGVARFSSENLVGGTPPYMAPEQIREENVDARTDIYALGITLYEMLSGGYVPFRGESYHSKGSTLRDKVKWEHLYLPLPPLQQFNSRISPSVAMVVEKALNKEPNMRYSSVLEFSEAFKQASANERDVSLNRTTIFKDIRDAIEPIAEKASVGRTTIRTRLNTLMSGMSSPSKHGSPALYGRAGEYQNQVIPIAHDGVRMGRSSQNHLVFREKSVSRMHAVVYVTQQGAFVRDEDSSLGTLLNGRRITGTEQLRYGDIIQIGYAQVFEYRD